MNLEHHFSHKSLQNPFFHQPFYFIMPQKSIEYFISNTTSVVNDKGWNAGKYKIRLSVFARVHITLQPLHQHDSDYKIVISRVQSYSACKLLRNTKELRVPSRHQKIFSRNKIYELSEINVVFSGILYPASSFFPRLPFISSLFCLRRSSRLHFIPLILFFS